MPQYLLGIGAGQQLYVTTTGTVSNVQVLDPMRNPVLPFGTFNGWIAFNIPQTGNYRVIVYGSGPISVTFYIPPLMGF